MANPWAISGVDLHLDVSGPRRRAGLEDALRDAVRSGRLPSGARLPSSRALAADLGLARNTVAEAYGQLVAEGWLVARQGSGTRVAERAAAAAAAAAAVTEPVPPRHDLRPGWPDVSAFPRSAWLAATRRALDQAPFDALGYGDPRGSPELRTALAGYLARARGVDATADRIVICAGFTQGLALLAHTVRAAGASTLALEAYGQPLHRRIVRAAGLAPRALPVDPHGAVLEALGARDDTALLTPAHQFPLGVALAPARRVEAVRWAKATGGLLIEDDYDGEFRYDRQPVGAMQALAPEHVVYAGSASKTLAPGLRLGWLVLPPHMVDAVVATKATLDRQHSAIDQLALADLIARGAYDRHVRRMRLVYRRRRDRLVAALARDAPAVRVRGIAAGLHALVTLPEGLAEAALVDRAAAVHGLALEGLSAYRNAGPPQPPALVVGYAKPPGHAYTATLARLGAALAQAGAGALSAASSVAPSAPPRSPSDASRIAGGR